MLNNNVSSYIIVWKNDIVEGLDFGQDEIECAPAPSLFVIFLHPCLKGKQFIRFAHLTFLFDLV